jgi:predicted ATPase/DNA-binding winged helix-turn-helix (wHTH) protein
MSIAPMTTHYPSASTERRSAGDRGSTPTVHFGRFRLAPHRRELLADGVLVPIGGRALDVLIVLIEARGKLVTKDEFLDRVWCGTIVEENTLQFQISMLRKALGEDHGFIKTISGRGYCFIADLAMSADLEPAPADQATAAAPHVPDLAPATNLPALTSGLVGREAQLADLADVVATHRLVTLVGTGGVGKTRLGVELARRLLPKFPDGVWLAELGSLSDPDQVLPAIAKVLGLADTPASPERLAAALASKRLLVMIDNCEHVIGAAARVAEAVLHAGTSLRVIATSREPLRADGEFVCPVPALDVPEEGADDIEDILRHSAVRLFIARARAGGLGLSLDTRVAATIATICRRLDGIPLAIELAATGAAALGVDGVASRLDDRFSLLTEGRRTATARHRTLRATFDWSYELLPERERLAMRRLAIFPGGFTLQAAEAVVNDSEDAEDEITGQVLGLVAKSLVIADVSGTEPRYRLLETTRAYALEKLAASGEFEGAAHRHAEHVRGRHERFAFETGTGSTAERYAACGRGIAEVRAALEWAFLPGADATMDAALTPA